MGITSSSGAKLKGPVSYFRQEIGATTVPIDGGAGRLPRGLTQ